MCACCHRAQRSWVLRGYRGRETLLLRFFGSFLHRDTGEISTCPGDAHLIDNDIVARPSCPGGRVRGVLPALRLGCCVRCKCGSK